MNTNPKAPITHELEKKQFEKYRGITSYDSSNNVYLLKGCLQEMTSHAEKLELELIEANKMIDIFKEEAKIRQNLYEKYHNE